VCVEGSVCFGVGAGLCFGVSRVRGEKGGGKDMNFARHMRCRPSSGKRTRSQRLSTMPTLSGQTPPNPHPATRTDDRSICAPHSSSSRSPLSHPRPPPGAVHPGRRNPTPWVDVSLISKTRRLGQQVASWWSSSSPGVRSSCCIGGWWCVGGRGCCVFGDVCWGASVGDGGDWLVG